MSREPAVAALNVGSVEASAPLFHRTACHHLGAAHHNCALRFVVAAVSGLEDDASYTQITFHL